VAIGIMAGLVGTIAVLSSPAAKADEVPPGAKWTEVYFEAKDGTMLHADVFKPANLKKGQKTPVILAAGPYFGSGGFVPPTPNEEGPIMRFPELFTEGKIMQRGYTYAQVDTRGYGSSQGCYDFGGPGEQMDVEAAVKWAAKLPWSNGEVGMWGKSYDGWTGVMALANKPKGLGAAVIQSPIIEGYRTLYMNGIHYDAGWYATPALYAGYDLIPPSVHSEPDEFVAAGTAAAHPDCYAQNLAMTKVDDPTIAYWKDRELIKRASGSKVPVLWSHGFLDANTKPDNFLDIWKTLRGPHRAWFGQYDHVRGNEANFVGRDGFMKEAMRWFDRYLKNKKGVPVGKDPRVEIQQDDGKWRAERAWPPRDAKRFALPLKKGAYTDEQGNNGQGTGGGNGSWSISQPLPYDVHMAGVPKVNVKVATQVPNAHLISILYDIDKAGNAKLISRGAYLLRDAGKTKFDMYPQDWKLEKGHRLGLLLAGSDEQWFSSVGTTNTEVTVNGGSVSLPFLRFARTKFLKGGPAAAMSTRVPVPVDKATIKDRSVKAKLPPKLKHR
jgi:predicted acyl esterase